MLAVNTKSFPMLNFFRKEEELFVCRVQHSPTDQIGEKTAVHPDTFFHVQTLPVPVDKTFYSHPKRVDKRSHDHFGSFILFMI